MATAYRIELAPGAVGNYHRGGYDEATAKKIDKLLQINNESFHILFDGLRHDHIVHALYSIYGLGGTPEELQMVFDREKLYQTPKDPIDEKLLEELCEKDKFMEYVDQKVHYSEFLAFFQSEIESRGVRDVLDEYLFCGDKLANMLLVRMFAGIFHPLLHLGYAMEYNQPAIVAEALAMCCVHTVNNPLEPLYLESEKLAGGSGVPGTKTLQNILLAAQKDEKLRASIHGKDPFDRCSNIVDNDLEKFVRYASEYSISDEQVEERLAELSDIVPAFLATTPLTPAGSSQSKVNFTLLHCVNLVVLQPSFVDHPWLGKESSIRLLEWIGRCHLLHYVSQDMPDITTAEIDNYRVARSWDEINKYGIHHPTDDGHLVKCLRTLQWGEQVAAKKYAKSLKNPVMKQDSWLKLGNYVTDKVHYEAKTTFDRWQLVFTTKSSEG